MVVCTKTFGFSAAHRLHSEALSEEENRAVFGKCNNPHGHGHNYTLEVTIQGEVDPHSGELMNYDLLEAIVQDEVIERFDHKHLNEEVAEFCGLNPTGENIAKVIWDLLRPRLGERLVKVGVWETPKSLFEYAGDG
ncbi:MAG: 6-carboxytetrahydropterin synthase [Thermodesulfobacteriota bacterium]|jgi:6-pyruvoyltetrahydropterin/6-carboxytetrahydropterin synthase